MTIAPHNLKPTRLKGKVPKQEVPGISRPMSYEEYLAGPEEMARYDIIDGWKVYRLYGELDMPNPSKEHQEILLQIADYLLDYRRQTKRGRVILAPCDVLITHRPFRSRQPDILFISEERMAKNRSSKDSSPLSPAPELVVEIVSPSERPSMLDAKIADYRGVDVKEIWLVYPQEKMVKVILLSIEEIRVVATYGAGEMAASIVFPGLTVSVDEIFAE